MFIHFLWFEIVYRLRRVATYIYFGIWFLVSFLSVATSDFGPVPNGKVMLNGPYAVTLNYVLLTMFGVFVISALFGTSILRDFKENTYQLIFTKPISKFAYLGGRWAGSAIVTTLVFSGLILGSLLGSLAPWADHARIAPIDPWVLVQPFVGITLVQILFLGSIFFMVAALTRNLVVVYLQSVFVFGAYIILNVYVQSSGNLDRFWPSVLDPVGIILVQSQTRYWTVVERNSQLLAWTGVFLYNRLLWLTVGAIAAAATYLFFPMSAEALTTSRRKSRKQADSPELVQARIVSVVTFPAVSRAFGGASLWPRFLSLVRLRFQNIVREIPFWAITLVMIALAVINANQAGRFRDTAVWPVTYLMTQVLQGSSSLFLIIVATMYAGELIWREKDVRFDQIHDSLPSPSWLNFLSQFTALALVELILVFVVMLCGIASQALNGYFHFELALYLKELLLVVYPGVLAFVLYALFWQTIVPNKFLGHGLVIGTNLIVPILYRYGIENRLLLLLETSPYTYSDMNGYGHFVPAVLWSSVYWFAFCCLLGLVAVALSRRGTDLSLLARLRRAEWRPLAIPTAIAALAFIGSGVWFYYNAHVLNEFRTAKDGRKMQAAAEKTYKKYETLPQPKVTAVDLAVDIYPERRSFSAHGSYLLTNQTGGPVTEIHISGDRDAIQELSLDRPSHIAVADKALGYWIYKLDLPLDSGQTIKLTFKTGFDSVGFRDGNSRNELAYNGTFFDRSFFPWIGYNRAIEIQDPKRRAEEGLPMLSELAARGDSYYGKLNLFEPDSDFVTLHSIVSTSADQAAIAPGYLKREWSQDGRRYFEYDMGDTRINNFFTFISGRYAVKRDRWKDINLEIYYHPGHEYNLDRMLQSSKKGLEYFEANFAPYQYRQYRVIEFPRYRQFAQSFPNTVPYSEALGFIQRVQKEDDLDEIFYVTAHELAHQWWGHQLVGSMTEGSNMLSESLAQYSALMVMEKEYGPANIRKFLKHELDQYLRGRGGELRRERPLALVQDESYVWYNKGSLAMYALRDYIGEDKLNAALRKFLIENRYAAKGFPDTRGFVAALREATPPDMQYLVSDLFESIVLFDNRTVSAAWTRTPDNKYKVQLTLESRKLKADGQGAETEMPVNDLIDVGIFSGPKNKEQALYLAKHRFTGKQTKLDFVVDRQPDRAGIDPYHKLIDRKPDDNVVDITKQ